MKDRGSTRLVLSGGGHKLVLLNYAGFISA